MWLQAGENGTGDRGADAAVDAIDGAMVLWDLH
jgi:hypothetical protein